MYPFTSTSVAAYGGTDVQAHGPAATLLADAALPAIEDRVGVVSLVQLAALRHQPVRGQMSRFKNDGKGATGRVRHQRATGPIQRHFTAA